VEICNHRNFIGVVVTSSLNNSFFMNWYAQANKGEGLEYFILLFGLASISLVAGGGRASADAAITKGLQIRQRQPKAAIA
jgi:putative oxidoreductase